MTNDLEGIFEAIALLEARINELKDDIKDLDERLSKVENVIKDYFGR